MRKEICRPAEKIRKLVKKCLHFNRFYDIVIKLAVRQRQWSIGQAVKTPPSHGGNRGSIPLSTALEPLNFSSRVLLRYMEINVIWKLWLYGNFARRDTGRSAADEKSTCG